MWESTTKYFSPFFSYMKEHLSRGLRKTSGTASRHENGAAADLSGVEVVQGVDGLVQRVLLRVQSDPACLREHHEFGQVGVGADDVADDVPFGGDDVRRGDAQLAAVADDEVGAARCGHVPAVHLRALLRDVVEDDVRAGPAGGGRERLHPATVGDDD